MNYWVQEYSLVRKGWVTAQGFHKGVGGGQRIVGDEETAKKIFLEFVNSQNKNFHSAFRLVESHWEGRICKSQVILTARY